MPGIADRYAAEHFTLNSIGEPRQAHVLGGLARFEQFISKPLEQATDQELRAWLVSLLNSGLAPSTVRFHLGLVRPFYGWCWRERIIDADTWLRIKDVAPPRGSLYQNPRPYSRKELRQMWAELDAAFPHATDRVLRRWAKGTSPYSSIKKHAMRLQLECIVELALVCGLRRGEIYQLSLEDLHFDNHYIVVHGKRVDQNDKVREVPYADSTREAVRAWLRLRGKLSPMPGAPTIWLSITGPDPLAPLRQRRMGSILHSFGDWTLHRLRHTCATERLRAGMDIEKLQRFLGHSNISMTLRYAQLVRGDIHKASERVDADFQRAIRPSSGTPKKP